MDVLKLQEDFIEKFQREITLKEKDAGVDYELKVRLKPNANEGIYIDLPSIKEFANYLQKDRSKATPPKDCDGIIIDIENSIVYLIEMKRTSRASTNAEISAQLTAGHKWWEHLSFCLNNATDFEVKKVAVMVEERRGRSRRKKDSIHEDGVDLEFYKMFGKSISLEFVR